MTYRKSDGGATTLMRLVDAGLTVADPAEDIRGRRVVDTAGEEVGRVDALFVDPRRRRVCYLRVAAGGVWGVGARCVLIPCTAVVRVAREVVVDRRRRSGRPGYAPTLTAERYWSERQVLAWAPFWARPVLDPLLAASTSRHVGSPPP